MNIETRFNSDTKLIITPVDPKEKQILTLALTGNRCVRIEANGHDWVFTLVPAMLREEALTQPRVNETPLKLIEEASKLVTIDRKSPGRIADASPELSYGVGDSALQLPNLPRA